MAIIGDCRPAATSLGIEHGNGHVDRFGLFYTHAEASGDISGNVLGRVELDAGSLDLNEDSIAGYWTHLSPDGWYVDVVAKYAWLNGSSQSNRGIGADLDGNSIAASVETGVPFVIADGWTIEPQAQLIWQRIDFDDSSDAFSEISHEAFDSTTGRLGARLERSVGALLAHLGVNLWHGFSEEPVRSHLQHRSDPGRERRDLAGLQWRRGVHDQREPDRFRRRQLLVSMSKAAITICSAARSASRCDGESMVKGDIALCVAW